MSVLRDNLGSTFFKPKRFAVIWQRKRIDTQSYGNESGITTMHNSSDSITQDSRKKLQDQKGLSRMRLGTVPRLVIALFLVTSSVLGLVVIQLSQIFEQHSIALSRQVLVDEISEYQRAIQQSAKGSTLFESSTQYLAIHQVNSLRSLIIDAFGNPILGTQGSRNVIQSQTVRSWIATPPAHTTIASFDIGAVPYMALTTPIFAGKKEIGIFVASSKLTEELNQSGQVLHLALLEAGIALVFSMTSGYFLLRRVMRAVGGITNAAIDIADGDLSRRIDYRGANDEVGVLAKTFDHMLNRLDGMMESQRQLLSDVSHQLRTPLTIIKGNLELIERSPGNLTDENRESFAFAQEEIGYMSHLIDQLLLLGRTMERDFIVVEKVDLRSFMADIYTAATVMARRRWMYLEPPDLVVLIDPTKIRGAILNLIENAIKVTTEVDTIEISVTTEASFLRISVSDSGPGIPSGMEDQIFERFARGSQPYQKGAGLGLSIVDAVAQGHGGSALVDRSIYGGAKFSILLPLNVVDGEEERLLN